MMHNLLQLVPLVLIGGIAFLISPASNILNVVTVPFGYQFQSCPYCPAFGVEKITYSDCACCGTETAENFGRSRRVDGEWYYYCSVDCAEEHEVNADGAR